MKNYKYNKNRALTSSTELELIILSEAVDYSQAKESDVILDIDVNKFYEHCYRKFFKNLIDRNVKYLNLNRQHMTYTMQIQFISVMNDLYLYDVEKLKLLDLAESFIQEYKNYLNK